MEAVENERIINSAFLLLLLLLFLLLYFRNSHQDAYHLCILIGRSRPLHISQRDSLHARSKNSFADQPVRFVDRLILNILLDHDSKDIGNVLVESPGLGPVF